MKRGKSRIARVGRLLPRFVPWTSSRGGLAETSTVTEFDGADGEAHVDLGDCGDIDPDGVGFSFAEARLLGSYGVIADRQIGNA